LREHKATVHERDFFKEPLSEQELSDLIGDRPVAEFISTRAKSYKTTGWDAKPPTKKQAIAAMLQDPTLLRRPILTAGKKLFIGWSAAEYESVV
jgi:arsenate reductase-like glutaredoxin family protein